MLSAGEVVPGTWAAECTQASLVHYESFVNSPSASMRPGPRIQRCPPSFALLAVSFRRPSEPRADHTTMSGTDDRRCDAGATCRYGTALVRE
jgi:hypothetical protein